MREHEKYCGFFDPEGLFEQPDKRLEKVLKAMAQGADRTADLSQKRVSGRKGTIISAKLTKGARVVMGVYQHTPPGGAKMRPVLIPLGVFDSHDEYVQFLKHHAKAKLARYVDQFSIDQVRLFADLFPAGDQAPVEDAVQLAELVFYGNVEVIEFTDLQSEALKLQCPALLEGPAGSGKTLVLFQLLQQVVDKLEQVDGEVLPVLYIAPDHLAKEAKRKWQELGFETKVTVLFKSADDIAKEKYPGANIVGFEAFEAWVAQSSFASQSPKNHGKKGKKGKKSKANKIDVEEMYRELKLIAAVGPEKYLKLGVRKSRYADDMRELAIKVFKSYQKTLLVAGDAEKKVDPCLCPLKLPDHASMSYILVDEAQIYPACQYPAILKEADSNVIAAMDSNQVVEDGFSSIRILYDMLDAHAIRFHSAFLTGTHRVPVNVSRAAENLLRLRNLLLGGVTEQGQVIEFPSYISTQGEVIWKDSMVECSEQFVRWQKSADVAFIVPNKEIQIILEDQYEFDQVFLIDEIIGSEYKEIIAIGFDIDFMKIARERGLSREDKPTPHQTKDKEAVSKFESTVLAINRLFVAMTRAQNTFCFISSMDGKVDERNVKGLREWLSYEEACLSEDMHLDEQSGGAPAADIVPKDNVTESSTPEEWFQKTVELIKKKAFRQAERVYGKQRKTKPFKLYKNFRELRNAVEDDKLITFEDLILADLERGDSLSLYKALSSLEDREQTFFINKTNSDSPNNLMESIIRSQKALFAFLSFLGSVRKSKSEEIPELLAFFNQMYKHLGVDYRASVLNMFLQKEFINEAHADADAEFGRSSKWFGIESKKNLIIPNEVCYLLDLVKQPIQRSSKQEESPERLAQDAPLLLLFVMLFWGSEEQKEQDEKTTEVQQQLKYELNRFLNDTNNLGVGFLGVIYSQASMFELFNDFLPAFSRSLLIPRYFRPALFNTLSFRGRNENGKPEFRFGSFLHLLCQSRAGRDILFGVISDHPTLLDGDPLPWHQKFEGEVGKDLQSALDHLQAADSESAAKLLSVPGFEKILAYKPPEGLEESAKKSAFLDCENPSKEYFVKLIWNKKQGEFKLPLLFNQPFLHRGVKYHCLYDAIAERSPHNKIFLEVVHEIVFEGKHILFETNAHPLKDFIGALIKAMSITDFYSLFIEPIVSNRYGMLQTHQNPHQTIVFHVFTILKCYKQFKDKIDLSPIVDELGEGDVDDIFSGFEEHEHHFCKANSLLNSSQEIDDSSSGPIAGSGETPDEEFSADRIFADLKAGFILSFNDLLTNASFRTIKNVLFVDGPVSDPSLSTMDAIVKSTPALMTFLSSIGEIQDPADKRRSLVLNLIDEINMGLDDVLKVKFLSTFFMKEWSGENNTVRRNEYCYLLDLIKQPVPKVNSIVELDQKAPLLLLFFIKLFLGQKGSEEKSKKVEQALKFSLNRFLAEVDKSGRHLFEYIFLDVDKFYLFADFLSVFFHRLVIPQYFKSVLFDTLYFVKRESSGKMVFHPSSFLQLLCSSKVGIKILSDLMTCCPALFDGDHLPWYQTIASSPDGEPRSALGLVRAACSESETAECAKALLDNPVMGPIKQYEVPKGIKESERQLRFLDHIKPPKDYYLTLLWNQEQKVFNLRVLFNLSFVHKDVIYDCLYHAIADRDIHKKLFLEIVYEIIFEGKHVVFDKDVTPLQEFVQSLIYAMNLNDFYALFIEPVIKGRYNEMKMRQNPHHTMVFYVYYFICHQDQYKKNIDLSPVWEEFGEMIGDLYKRFSQHEREFPKHNSIIKRDDSEYDRTDVAGGSNVYSDIDAIALQEMLGAGASGPQPKSIEGLDTPANKLSILCDLNEGKTDSLRLLAEQGRVIVEQVFFNSKMIDDSKPASLMETILAPENRRAAFTLFNFLSEVQYIIKPRDPRAISLAIVLRRFSDWIIKHLSPQYQAVVLRLFLTPTFNLDYNPDNSLRSYSTERTIPGVKSTESDSEFYLLELVGQHFHPLKNQYEIPDVMIQMFIDIFVSSGKSYNKLMRSILGVQLNRFFNEVNNLGRNFLYLIFADFNLHSQFSQFLLAMLDGWVIDNYFDNVLFQTLFGNDCIDGVHITVVTSLLSHFCAGVNEKLNNGRLSFLAELIRKYPGLLKGSPLPWYQDSGSPGQFPLAVLSRKAKAGDYSSKVVLGEIKTHAPHILDYRRPTGLSKNDVACSLDEMRDIEEVFPVLLKLLSQEDWSCDLFFTTTFKHENPYYENSVVIYEGLYQFIIDRPPLRSAFIFALSSILHRGQHRVIKPDNYEQALIFFRCFIQRASMSEIYEVLGGLFVESAVNEDAKAQNNQNSQFLALLCVTSSGMCDDPEYADKLKSIFAESPSADASVDKPLLDIESVKGLFCSKAAFFAADADAEAAGEAAQQSARAGSKEP